jgi:hypothetical protein
VDLLLNTLNGKFARSSALQGACVRVRADKHLCARARVERSGEIKGLQKVDRLEGERVARLNAIGCSVPCNWIRFGATTTATTTGYVHSHYRCILRYRMYRTLSLSLSLFLPFSPFLFRVSSTPLSLGRPGG